MIHKFLDLPYEYNSLEPYIDEETMRIHHDKHHKAYFDKFVTAIEKAPELQEKTIDEILSDISKIPEEIKTPVINNGGGYYNHNFFFSILGKEIPFNIESKLGQAIVDTFDSFDYFKEQFSNAAATQFGSGWAWLVLNKNTNELEIIKTSNQDCPLSIGKIPLIGIDVWEHAYYLKYQNQRPKYIEAFWNVINWEKVEELFVKNKR